MKITNQRLIRTTCGKPFDLAKAAPLAYDESTPYGSHNFVVYKTMKGLYVKGYNTDNPVEMLDAYELISRSEAMHYLMRQQEMVLAIAPQF